MVSKSNIKSIEKALDTDILMQPIDKENFDIFKKEFGEFLGSINEKETEGHNKTFIIKFLNAIYKDKYFINTKENIDLVIHNDSQPDSSVGVLIETKRPKNKTDMVSHKNLNVISFQELLLYYLRERIKENNFKLRHLIITDFYEWFVFDARDFEDTFKSDKELVEEFNEFENETLAVKKTRDFYKEIANPAINRNADKIKYTYFDIKDYQSDDGKLVDNKKLVELYKFFSPEHLLKIPVAKDKNKLNKKFYEEILHIIGLEEITKDGKKLINRKGQDAGSIIENAISAINLENRFDKIDPEKYGQDKQERLFNVALELTITWINRILFLKLLEAQIIKYNEDKKDFAFLSSDKLNGYGALNRLFFLFWLVKKMIVKKI